MSSWTAPTITTMPPELFKLYSAAREVCRPPPGLGQPELRHQQMARLGVAVGVVEVLWHSEKVRHYMTLVDGLFALRAVGPLSQEIEGEIAGAHAEVWETLTEEEQEQVEQGIERLKEKWKVR